MKLVKKGSLKRVEKQFVVKMFHMPPQERVTDTAFGDEAMM